MVTCFRMFSTICVWSHLLRRHRDYRLHRRSYLRLLGFRPNSLRWYGYRCRYRCCGMCCCRSCENRYRCYPCCALWMTSLCYALWLNRCYEWWRNRCYEWWP